jgi:deazaflavin-dependent oxidoreductase (nitroreductase family)
MPLPRQLAKFNRIATNRIMRPLAGHVPTLGMVIHHGRRSGREYRTPVTVFPVDGGYRVALTYGRDVDWLKNVLAADRFELRYRGRTVTLEHPSVGHDDTASWAPVGVKQLLTALGATDYVQAARTEPAVGA